MRAKSIKATSTQEFIDELGNACSDGFRPTLAVVFLSIKQDRTAICNILDAEGIAIYGATTGGEFIDEEIGEGSAAILLLEIDPSYFLIQFAELDGVNDRNIAVEMGKKAQETYSSTTFLITVSHFETNPELIIRGLQDAVGSEVDVFGALAGDDFTMTEQFVFTNGKSSSRGCITVAFDSEKVAVEGVTSCGWEPLGTEKTITKSDGQWIYTIDDQPAFDVIKRFTGLDTVTADTIQKVVVETAVQCPIQLQRDEGAPIMRGVFGIDWKTKAVMCSGSMPQGSKFRFSVPPELSVIDKVIKAADDLKRNKIPKADALIMYSCLGRYISFGPLMSKEIEGVKNVWNVPMVGFFSNGEIGRAGGDLEYHGSNTVSVVLKEKNQTNES